MKARPEQIFACTARLDSVGPGIRLNPILSSPAFCTYAILLFLAYTVVSVHTPLAILADAVHDDALFVVLGRSLADGRWLGSFNQFTLMKGPGYPAFLALNHWLSTPVSFGHALFHCAALAAFVLVVHPFVRSLAL